MAATIPPSHHPTIPSSHHPTVPSSHHPTMSSIHPNPPSTTTHHHHPPPPPTTTTTTHPHHFNARYGMLFKRRCPSRTLVPYPGILTSQSSLACSSYASGTGDGCWISPYHTASGARANDPNHDPDRDRDRDHDRDHDRDRDREFGVAEYGPEVAARRGLATNLWFVHVIDRRERRFVFLQATRDIERDEVRTRLRATTYVPTLAGLGPLGLLAHFTNVKILHVVLRSSIPNVGARTSYDNAT